MTRKRLHLVTRVFRVSPLHAATVLVLVERLLTEFATPTPKR
jgi:hypothetical protein